MHRSERFTVGERARVEVQIPAGSVHVRQGGAGTIRLDIDSGDADELDVTQAGDTISVHQPTKWRARSVRVTAVVPEGTEVDLVSASANFRLDGTLGPARLRSTSGDIEVERVTRLDLSSTSGDSRVRDVVGDCNATSVSGDCTFDRVGGRLTLTSVSGDLRVAHLVGDLKVGTTSGDVRIDRCDGDDIAMKTISGTLDLALPTGIRVEADLSTLSGKATYPDTGAAAPDAASATAGPRRLVRLSARSVSGDLVIRRARS